MFLARAVAVWAIEAVVRSCSGLGREPERPEWEFSSGCATGSGQPVLECGGQCSLEVRCSQIPSGPQAL